MHQQYQKAKTGKILLVCFAVCSVVYLGLLYWINQRVDVADISGLRIVIITSVVRLFRQLRLFDLFCRKPVI